MAKDGILTCKECGMSIPAYLTKHDLMDWCWSTSWEKDEDLCPLHTRRMLRGVKEIPYQVHLRVYPPSDKQTLKILDRLGVGLFK